jgi:hypothetical protein
MYSTTAYLYQQIVRVLLVDTSGGYFTARYDPVYAKSLTVNKGVDNVLLFEFINQDQKPVNITGSTFIFRLVSQNGDRLLLEKTAEILNAPTGRAKVTLTQSDTVDLVAQPASYSLQRNAGDYQQAVYSDDNSQARANCNIVDSVFPAFVQSQTLTIPTISGQGQQLQPGPTDYPDWAQQPPPVNTTQLTEFYSSEFSVPDQSLVTVKMDLDHYTGTIKFQAADNYQAVWADVSPIYEFFSETSTQYFNIVGFYPLLRAAFNNSQGQQATATLVTTDGVVTGVTMGNPGQGYVAAPRVQILGNGAGAAAVAQINDAGLVTGIVVTAGGAGYLPLQFQGSQTGTVLIDNGTITNLQYR